MELLDRYDVVIAGGGLAGLCLAIQLEQRVAGIRILVAEKNDHPFPEAAHKVGESSVEMASHYFTDVLGLGDILATETPKFGLRFFLSHDGNRDIAARPECGPSHFLYVPSFQIDRGRFENALARKARASGVDFVDGCRVKGAALGGGDEDHIVSLTRSSGSFDLRCRWLVDATGRPGLLKKELGLARPNRHDVNAAWFRIDHAIDIDDWSDDPSWTSRLEEPRRLSTNHLMGEGYWVWLIPLVNDRTSVGIVTDARLHSFSGLNTFEKALAWLDEHEPQCATVVRSHADKRMDFLALRDYSHDVKQLFSRDRWCLTGDAGAFIDPFYSPGSDFIAIANGFICDLVARDARGEEVGAIAEIHDQTFRSLVRTYLVTYHRQYPIMGNARVMSIKIVWDFVMYWGGIAPLFFRDRFQDPIFMERVRPVLLGFASMNIEMQAFFREWAREDRAAEPGAGAFVDYAEIRFLAELNRNLLREYDDDSLIDQLARNLHLAGELQREIRAETSRTTADASKGAADVPTAHLKDVFAALGPARPGGALPEVPSTDAGVKRTPR